jgi:hypothetical protein
VARSSDDYYENATMRFPCTVVNLHVAVNNTEPISLAMDSLCSVAELQNIWYCCQKYKCIYGCM